MVNGSLLQCKSSLNIMFDQHFNDPSMIECYFEDPSMNSALHYLCLYLVLSHTDSKPRAAVMNKIKQKCCYAISRTSPWIGVAAANFLAFGMLYLETQLPCHEAAQATMWRSPYGELRPPTRDPPELIQASQRT